MVDDGRVAFSVVAEWSGRKFKMMLEEKDLQSMKVEKIKRTLGKFTSMRPEEFELRTSEGIPLVVGMKGGNFNLHAGMMLRMHKIGDQQQHQHQYHQQPTRVTSMSPAHKNAGVASPTIPPYRGSAGRVTPPPPAARSITPRFHDPEIEEGMPPGTSSSPALTTRRSSMVERDTRDTREISPLRPLPTASPRSSPALPPSGLPTHSPPAPIPVQQEQWRPNLRMGLNNDQIRLQEQLIQEAQVRSPVPNINDVLSNRRPTSPGMSNMAESLLEGPSLCTPLHPSWVGTEQLSHPGVLSSRPPSPALLEAKIKELRIENEALRVENKVTASQLEKTQKSVPHDNRSISPAIEKWIRSSPTSAQHTPAPLAQSMPPSLPQSFHEPDGEVQQLLYKCNDLDKSKRNLEHELELMKKEWSEERRLRMAEWEEEHFEWTRKQQQLVSGWEADKQLLLTKNLDPQSLMRIHKKWECADSKWDDEKSALMRNIEKLSRQREDEEEELLTEQTLILEELKAKKVALNNEVRELKSNLARSRHETGQNKLFVVGASQSLEELQGYVSSMTGLRSEEAKQTVHATTEKAMLAEKVKSMKVQNENLAQTLQKETALRKHLHNTLEDIKGSIRAIVRQRPLLPSDQGTGEEEAAERGVASITDSSSVTVVSPTTGTKEYHYYRALKPEASQEEVFAEIRPLLQSTLDGFNVCVMAYGQTGSGKTYTIMGDTSAPRKGMGVLPRAIEELFMYISRTGCEFEFRCSMVELYLDTLRDLLTPEQKKCELHQLPSGLQITCSDHLVHNTAETLGLLKHGNSQRQVHSTLMNPHSSRSHAVFTINIKLRHENVETTSKLTFVDLAGSERVKVSLSKGDRLKEAQMINKSLSALGDVVASLSQPKAAAKKFVPYRNSKLTMILQEALGGNSKTVLFACICPSNSNSNISETVSTLVFANRIKHVHNPYLRNIITVQNRALEEYDNQHEVNAP
eukprot:TRINITY_DN24515_c0_g1_i1.p1 TRINITY_DN24515_c0_g1~~TRINITY_DN24515_c0_g1_i1.p1  ORF type:complete len:974 (+),score=229.72 TRINITY_DN24515_c0_g1_i1:98-3019(+)